MNATDISQAATREGIADYRFTRMLGTGNHGAFYLAPRPERLPVSEELVAVKVLSGTSSEKTFRRATRELAAFAAVNSPYLVVLYNAGQDGSELYYSMEYVAGGSLAHPAGPVPPGAARTAVAHAARAAHALHEAGIAHNDIKPGNVLLDVNGGKLADLGLSKVLRPGVTITGLGSSASVEFLDPALLRGEAPSRGSDIFALGATLHWVLAGKGLYGRCPGTTRSWRCAACCPGLPRSRPAWIPRRVRSSPRPSARTGPPGPRLPWSLRRASRRSTSPNAAWAED